MLNEKKLTKAELNKREELIMKMKKNKRALVKKYGKDAEQVMYGRATNIAKKQAESMENDKLKEMVKTALQNPKAADLNKDGKLSDYEEKRGAAIEKNLDEIDINDPVLMKMRAAKMKAANAGDDGNDKFFAKNAARLGKLKALKDKRAQIMSDMEQEAELEGGPIADKYGDMLNKLDKAIAMLQGQGEWGPEKDVDITAQEIGKRAAMIGLEEGSSTEEKRIAMSAIKRLAKYRGVSTEEAKADLLRAVKELGDLKEEFDLDIDQEGGEQADTDKSQAGILDAEAGLGLEEDLDLGHQDNEPHMLKADLYRIGKYAMELYQMVDGFEGQGEVDFPHWWQSKIIRAKDMLVGAKHYLDFEIKEPQIDAMVDVASEEEVIDENAIGINDKRLDDKQKSALDLAVRGDSSYSFGNNPYADDQLRYKYAVKMGFLEETIDKNEVEEDLFTPNEIGDEAIDSESASGAFEGVAKKLAKQIKEGTKKSLNEFTDNDFSGNALIANTKVPGRDELATFDYYFPDGVASRRNAIASLQAHDESPIKARMGRYAPMFVHVQYHEFEDESGEKYRVHQKQFYNSNFKDNDPTFNPGVTKLHLTKLDPSGDRDKEIEIGSILVKTEDYIKDLKKLNIIDRQS